MPARKATPIRPVGRVQAATVKDTTTQQALDAVASAVQALQARRERDYQTVNLVVGINRIPHGLGRPYLGFNLTRKTLNIAFDACVAAETNPRPDREIWIDVTGSAETDVALEVY